MSATVSFQDAMHTLQEMFSHIPRDTIKQVLVAHGGVMERAVNSLLSMPTFPHQQQQQVPAARPIARGRSQVDVDINNARGDVYAAIVHLEGLKQAAIQRENFLEAEDIKRRLQALRVEQANREAAAIAESRTSSNNSDGSANQDDLTPLFLRRRSQRRRLELPENFLRSPAFRHQIIQNKILASDVALKIHDEMQREQVCYLIYVCRCGT